MKKIFIIIICKIVLKVTRLINNGGSALPGLIAEKLDKNIICNLVLNFSEGIILVTGTNGKTTTTKIIAEVLKDEGKEIVNNKTGSNLSRGIISALIEKSNFYGKVNADIGLFEVDEAVFPSMVNSMKPKSVLILNLFRDQLDRYGELDLIADAFGKALAHTKAKIFLNADDPLVATLNRYIKAKNQVYYFGIQRYNQNHLKHDYASDSNYCPRCNSALLYKINYYGHIGHWYCPKMHIKRPIPQFQLVQDNKSNKINNLQIKTKLRTYNFKFNLPGLYNAYNALAAIAILDKQKISTKSIIINLQKIVAAFGRAEKIDLKNRSLYLLLIKNPSGFNQVIQTFLTGPNNDPTLIIVNDNYADGRDVSWLFDVAFEDIKHRRRTIIASGIRAYDLAVRMKYAGIKCQVETDPNKALAKIINLTPRGHTIYVLPTYTAMLKLRNHLSKITSTKGIW